MPKYKEIRINVTVSPEAVLEGVLGGATPIHAEQSSQTDMETANN